MPNYKAKAKDSEKEESFMSRAASRLKDEFSTTASKILAGTSGYANAEGAEDDRERTRRLKKKYGQ